MRKNPHVNNTIPYCETCHGSGPGYEFPLFPQSKNWAFGEVCAECDVEQRMNA
jgi:hypothetical protein|tara:strand:- start:214 stop:372 length:159 start_codon:yes stop_codon:yes gene_type:complete